MSNKFDVQSHKLKMALESETKHEEYEGYLLKGGISGIQNFIFSIKSEGAAKTLKAKSFYVQVAASISVRYLLDRFNLDEKDLLYNGGGSFYLLIPLAKSEGIEDQIPEIKKTIGNHFLHEGIYVNLSYTKIGKHKAFEDVWLELNVQKTGEDKLKKFQELGDMVFEPFFEDEVALKINNDWRKITNKLKNSNSESIKAGSGGLISKLDYSYDLEGSGNMFYNKVINKFPLWSEKLIEEFESYITDKQKEESQEEEFQAPKKGDIIEFGYLAKFAKDRTGTDKLGVLKLDLDSLGSKFHGKAIEQTRNMSKALTWFFEEYIWELLQGEFSYKTTTGDGSSVIKKTAQFNENIYVVFSGGDDCFLLGAWDAIFEFAHLLQAQFNLFSNGKITLSASLTVVDSSYPISRFAKMAEEALENAKHFKSANEEAASKNKISVFGEILSWKDYEKVIDIRNELLKLILDAGESRGILERIKMSSVGYDSLQEKAKAKKISHQQVWRFSYYLRGVKTEKGKAIIEGHNGLIKRYQRYLINAISKNEYTNAVIFPVAARWTEFLTRKKT